MTNVPTDAELQARADKLGAVFVNESKLKDSIKAVDFHIHEGSQLTICIITMLNGYTVTGQSACADPKMFDREVGEKFAFADAEKKIWPLLGYVLKEKLYLDGVTSTPQGRVQVEARELQQKLTSLGSFIGGNVHFANLHEDQQKLLVKQKAVMEEYLDILNQRIERF